MQIDDPIYHHQDGSTYLVDTHYHPKEEGFVPPNGDDGGPYLGFFWRCFDKSNPDRSGYVCPCCGNVWSNSFAGMPQSFIAHVDPTGTLIKKINRFMPPGFKEFAKWMENTEQDKGEYGCYFNRKHKKGGKSSMNWEEG